MFRPVGGEVSVNVLELPMPRSRDERWDEVWMLTFENWVSSASAGVMPRFSHILAVRTGHELPGKMRVLRIAKRVSEKF